MKTPYSIRGNVLAATIVSIIALGMSQTASAQSRAPFDCVDYAIELEFAPMEAATLCRQVRQNNFTAVFECARTVKDSFNTAVAANVCRNTNYQQLSATYDCMRGYAAEIGAESAADLCQGTSYQSYSDRINCFNWMQESFENEVAARICGGEHL